VAVRPVVPARPSCDPADSPTTEQEKRSTRPKKGLDSATPGRYHESCQGGTNGTA